MKEPTFFDIVMTCIMSGIIGAGLALIYLDTIGVISVYEILSFG
jgi:hypothetical protein